MGTRRISYELLLWSVLAQVGNLCKISAKIGSEVSLSLSQKMIDHADGYLHNNFGKTPIIFKTLRTGDADLRF